MKKDKKHGAKNFTTQDESTLTFSEKQVVNIDYEALKKSGFTSWRGGNIHKKRNRK